MYQENNCAIINKNFNQQRDYIFSLFSGSLYPADFQNDDLWQVTTKDTQTIEMFRQG